MRARSKKQGRNLADSLEFAFRRRYNLAPTDPRFLDATTEDILTDHWAHFYSVPGTKEEVEDEAFNLDEVVNSMKDDDWEEVK